MHYKAAAYRYHTRMNVSSKPERTRLSAEDWELAAMQLISAALQCDATLVHKDPEFEGVETLRQERLPYKAKGR